MSHRKSKPKNKPSLSNSVATLTTPSTLHLSAFHPVKPLFAVATTATGQNVVRIYDTNRPGPGAQEIRCEVRLKRGEEVSYLAWTGYDGKKRKRAQATGELLAVGMTSGRIYIVEQALGEIVKTLDGHTASVRGWSTEEDRGWSCGGDGKIKCWEPRTGNCLLTMSPAVEGLEFTALAISQEAIFLSSLQTLYLLNHSSGEIVTQVTAHTTPIHTIQYSPELNIVTTAAVGDRFITVFSSEGNTLTRLGSLTCTHDVRSFILQKDTLLAITIIGTLEIFTSFYTFEAGKKGGLTKPPHAEIHLTTAHRATVEIQDAVPHGKETMISWIEGIKTGFEILDTSSMSGKVDFSLETRQGLTQLQTTTPYNESTAIVSIGTEAPVAKVNGTATETSEVSFADRLSQLHPQSQVTTAPTTAIVPNASSLSTVLTQALNSSDEKLLQSCFNPSYDHQTIHNTLVRLSPPLIPSLLNYFNSVLSRKQKRVDSTLAWIREAVVIHGGYLVSQGQEVREVLIQLKGTLDRRGQTWERLVRLKGRLEILRAIKGQSTTAKGREPEVTWVEEDEDVEPEVEDVRYLRDAEEEDGEGMDDIEEVDGADDVLVVNGIGSEDEVDDDESSSDEAIEPIKKVNGIPHMSDSEDSAVDLADLIDDEASEASDEENSDDVSEDDEDDEEEEEEIEDIPPPKKSRSRR